MAEDPNQPPDTLAPYRAAVREHGATFKATLWASEEKQQTRFRVLSEVMPLGGRTVLDVGAGLSDLSAYLAAARIEPERIIALEGVPELAAEAERRHLPRTEHVVADFSADPGVFERVAGTRPIDIALFSGSLNAMEMADALRCVEAAWAVARHGVAFNFLSARGGRTSAQTKPAVPYDPAAVLTWALGRTPTVLIRHDYMGAHDATVAMYRPSGV
ncbi:MAG: class I SAM-dependent methyltransferase [Planctomycetota bacterium]